MWEIGEGPQRRQGFRGCMQGKFDIKSSVAYHFPVRVGGGLDVPVVGLVVDRGDGGDRRGGRDWRADGRVLLLNRHVGRVLGLGQVR